MDTCSSSPGLAYRLVVSDNWPDCLSVVLVGCIFLDHWHCLWPSEVPLSVGVP